MSENEEFRMKVYQAAVGYLRFLKEEKNMWLVRLSEKKLRELVAESEVTCVAKNQEVFCKNGGFLLKGSLLS